MKLSICITIKNRSLIPYNNRFLSLFPNCIESLVNSLSIKDDIELIITDWNSTDKPIKTWIEDAFPYYPIHLITINGNGFNRGKGRNIAAQYAQGDKLFFLDADMLVIRDVIEDGLNYTSDTEVFYPIPWYYTNEQQTEGNFNSGVGNVFITKEALKRVGFWPEYESWGFEDLDLYKKLQNNNIKIHTKQYPTFTHQWHPQTKEFKNQYSINNDDDVKDRLEFYQKQYIYEQQQITNMVQNMLKANLLNTNRNLL